MCHESCVGSLYSWGQRLPEQTMGRKEQVPKNLGVSFGPLRIAILCVPVMDVSARDGEK